MVLPTNLFIVGSVLDASEGLNVGSDSTVGETNNMRRLFSVNAVAIHLGEMSAIFPARFRLLKLRAPSLGLGGFW